MTRRQRLEAVINGEITEELIESCREELEKLDIQGARASERAKTSTNYVANKELEPKIYEFLEGFNIEEPAQIELIREVCAPELSRQRVTAICTNLVREGRIGTVDVKVKNKGKRKGYYAK